MFKTPVKTRNVTADKTIVDKTHYKTALEHYFFAV